MQNLPVPTNGEPKRRSHQDSTLGHRLDELDVLILRNLLARPPQEVGIRKPLSAIARVLGVDEATVRTRLNKWSERGLLVGWGALLNPSLVGLRASSLRFELPEKYSKREAIEQLRLLEGVWEIRDYFGRWLHVGVFYDESDTIENMTRLLPKIFGVDKIVRADFEFPPALEMPDTKDMMIIGSMAWSPRKPSRTIARETGLSTKTIAKRMLKILEGRICFIGCFLEYRNMVGILKGDMLVFYKRETERTRVDEQILRIVGNSLLMADPPRPGYGWFTLLLGNLSQQVEILERVLNTGGVTSAYLQILVQQEIVSKGLESLEKRVLKGLPPGGDLHRRMLEIWSTSWKSRASGLRMSAAIG